MPANQPSQLDQRIEELAAAMATTPRKSGFELLELLTSASSRKARAGDADEAFALSRRAIPVAELLAREDPAVEHHLARAYSVCADRILNLPGKNEREKRHDSLDMLLLSLEIWRKLEAGNPGQHRAEIARAVAQASRAGLERFAAKERLELIREAAARWERLAAEDLGQYGHNCDEILRDLEFELSAERRPETMEERRQVSARRKALRRRLRRHGLMLRLRALLGR